MPLDDAIESLAHGAAKGVTEAVLNGIAAQGPQIVTGLIGAWRKAWGPTLEIADKAPPPTPAMETRHEQDIAAGLLPPDDVR